jgi:hypothetical protein
MVEGPARLGSLVGCRLKASSATAPSDNPSLRTVFFGKHIYVAKPSRQTNVSLVTSDPPERHITLRARSGPT